VEEEIACDILAGMNRLIEEKGIAEATLEFREQTNAPEVSVVYENYEDGIYYYIDKKSGGGIRGPTGAGKDSGVRFLIRYDARNRPFGEVEKDILKGVPVRQWVKTVQNNLRKKFPGGVRIGRNMIHINKATRMEMTYSKYMQWALKNDWAAYRDKLRATDNADEILKASRNYVNEAPLHPRKDNIMQFARGSVLLRIGKKDYEASVIVGTKKDGTMLLYDFLYLKPTRISA